MIPVRAGILLGFLCFALSVRSQAQKVNSIPEVSHQDGLSRVSLTWSFGGPTIYTALGLEYSALIKKRYSIDLRLSGFVVPNSKSDQTYIFNTMPVIQYGRKTSRFIVGLGYSVLFNHGYEEVLTDDGYGVEYIGPRPYGFMHGIIPTVGYRVQHKHGFFVELDAHVIFYNQQSSWTEREWSYIPWGGLIFGYRLPSRAMRDKWKAESRKYKPLLHKERNAKREAKTEKREDRQLERQFNRADKREKRSLRDERMKAEFKPVRMDSTKRRFGHVFGEAYGLATWTLNYTYTYPFKKVENFGLVGRIGAGYTEMLSVPVGIGIQFLKMNNSVSLNTGIVLTSKAKTTVFYYTGFTGHINLYKGLTMGLGGYLLINPHGSHIEFNRRNDISIMMGGSLGYRLGK